MRKAIFLLLLSSVLLAQTKINLTNQTIGTLPAQNGGTGSTVNGNPGQVLIGDGAGHFVPADPIVSYAFDNLFNAAPATAGRTSTPIRIPTLNASGTLFLTFAGITGSPAGCTLQILSGDSVGNFINNGSAISLTVANGTTSQAFNAAAATSNAAQIEATYSCSTFPTTGTITIDFAPIVSAAGSGGGGGTVNQGSPNTVANAWPTKIIDSAGVNVATVDSSGNVNVHVQAGGGSGGTSSNFGSAFPSTGTAAGAKVVSSTPSLTAGNMEAPELTTSGRFIVDGSQVTQPVSGTVTTTPPTNASTNVTQFGGANVATGTGASGSGIPRVTVSNDSNVLATQSGTWTFRIFGNTGNVLDGVAGASPGTAAANQVQVGGEFLTSPPTLTNGQGQALMMDNKGNLLTNGSGVTQPVSGTVTTSPPANASTNVAQFGGTNVVTGTGASGSGIPRVTVSNDSTVTANAGTNLNTSALALDTSVNGVLVSQGSTTSGEKGPMVQAAVTTAAPTYTTAQTSPLSLNTSGGLRVDGSGVTQPVSGTVTANAGTGTFNIQANASVNVNQVAGSAVSTAATGVQKVGITGNAGAAMDAAGQNAASPANELIAGCQFNTSPTTITSGNVSPIQCNSTGSVKVDGSAVTQPVSGTVTANQGGAPWTVIGTLADNGNAATTNRIPDMPAISQSTPPAAATAGNNAALLEDKNRSLIAALLPPNFPTYSAATTVTAAASPTDVCGMPGNATNTVLVTRVELTMTQTTAGVLTGTLLTRGTADTAGTSSNTTVGKMDRNNANAVSVPLTYTANPTINDASPTNIRTWQVGAMATGTASPNDIAIYSTGNSLGQGIVLRGTAQVLYINFGATAHTGLSVSCTFQWMELPNL